MPSDGAFERFAPAILGVYRRDREAFWAAVLAPFLLDRVSLLEWFGHLKTDLALVGAFRGLDAAARQQLKAFGEPLGLDPSRWKSSRAQYLKDAYPVFAFLVVWMEDEGLTELVSRFADVLRAGVYAVAGYGILDANVDSPQPSPVEVLTAQALITEYEALALDVFGASAANLGIMHRMRRLFLDAEIREKAVRGKSSPYTLDRPEQLGAKGANAVTPFMLSLERLGRAAQTDDYWRVFLLFGAAIQVVDDWSDLEEDLACGHYSWVTLGGETDLDPRHAARTAARLRADTSRVRASYDCSKAMLAEARALLERLGDRHLFRLVEVTDARVETAFRKLFTA